MRSGTTNRRRPVVPPAEERQRKATRTRARRLPAARPQRLEPDEPAGVDIWHWMDPVVMARQKLSATQDRRQNLLATWNLDSGKLVTIGKSYTRDGHADPAHEHGARLRVVRLRDGSVDRPPRGGSLRRRPHDRRAHQAQGQRQRPLHAGEPGRQVPALPPGRSGLHDQPRDARDRPTSPKASPTSFIDKESDETVKQKPPFGIAGWTKDDAAVVMYDKYDLWEVPVDGQPARSG